MMEKYDIINSMFAIIAKKYGSFRVEKELDLHRYFYNACRRSNLLNKFSFDNRNLVFCNELDVALMAFKMAELIVKNDHIIEFSNDIERYEIADKDSKILAKYFIEELNFDKEESRLDTRCYYE